MANKKKTTSTKKSTSKRQSHSTSTSKKSHMDSMKAEIASELGVNLGPDATARQNGSVGGEMTKRLVSQSSKSKSNKKK